jgi:PAS domain S-box-containing protein
VPPSPGNLDEHYARLVASIEDYAIFMLDLEGRVTTWNAGAERIAGYRADEVLDRHFEVFDPSAALVLERVLREGRCEDEGWRFRKDGTQFWASVALSVVRDATGAPNGLACVIRDLTEQHQAEQQRLAAEQRYRLLVDSIHDHAIFMLDPDGDVTTWNIGAERVLGYPAREIIGRHHATFGGPIGAASLAAAKAMGRAEHEGWMVRKDGTRFWANLTLSAVRDVEGALLGFGAVTRDLTERREAEELRRAAEERFQLLIESVKDYAIFILDPRGNVATWNAGAERIKGYRAEEIIGSHFSRFYPAEDVRAGKCEMELELAARDGRFEDEGWRIRKDGSRFWANVVISAVRDAMGRLVGYSKVTRDLTERKRIEEERTARLAAEEANRTKDEFLAMLGHELRNPLAPIVSALQLLRLRGDDRSAREHEIIERQVAQLTRLVDDLLDVSRVTRGKITLRREPFDLRTAIAKAMEITLPAFEQKDQRVEVTSPRHPIVVNGDEARLVQVFTNLLANASRYTPERGRITLGVRELPGEVAVDIRDNGIGIDPGLLPRIFDLFVQGERGTDRSAGGLGLGLTLVRSLTELHTGAVEVSSPGHGQGSTFTVRLPTLDEAALAAPASAAPAVAGGRRPQRILLVDDNDDARMLLADTLRAVGHEVREASDGEGGLAELASYRPDVAILDIGLPGIDGYEVARQIRARPDGAVMRLIALSGYGQLGDKERSKAAGIDIHLTKPIKLAQLLAQLS